MTDDEYFEVMGAVGRGLGMGRWSWPKIIVRGAEQPVRVELEACPPQIYLSPADYADLRERVERSRLGTGGASVR